MQAQESSSPLPPAPAPVGRSRENQPILRPHPPPPSSFPPGSMQRRFIVHYWQDAAPPRKSEQKEDENNDGHTLKGGKGQHQYLYEHGNGLFVVGLAKEHVAIQACQQDKTLSITRVEFLPSSSKAWEAAAQPPPADVEGGEEGEGGDEVVPTSTTTTATNAAVSARMKEGKVTTRPPGKNKKKGKSKDKGVYVRRDTVVATVALSNGQVFPVYASIHGQLLELNETLMTDPGLLLRQPENNGFLAIIQPPRPSNNAPPNLSHMVSHDVFHATRKGGGR